MNTINFTGTYISPAKIKKLEGNSYKQTTANFVELDARQGHDFQVLDDLQYSWGAYFNKKICNDAFRDEALGEKRFFVLTTQDDNFELMNDKNVLGVVEVSDNPNTNRIEYLQVNPKYISKKEKSIVEQILSLMGFEQKKEPNEYKDIGTGILDSLKEILEKPIDLYSAKNAKDFYTKNGFVNPRPRQPAYFVWSKEN